MLAIEAVAGAEILQRWIDAPVWLMALLLMALLTGINLASVKSFGEFEFWFAGIKVVAIVAFIVIAAGFLFGIGAGDSPGLSNLTSNEGFAPEGIITIFSGVVVVIFAFVGAEIVTIAAAESEEPEENVTKAVNQVVLRILTFYVAAIFLIVCILPWNDAKPGESPFIASLEIIGIPGAADVMNAVIVTAVLSCLNSGMYTGSRMLFALARRGDAPKGLLDVNRRGVPVKAILLTSSIGFASTGLAYLSPDTVFLFLVNSSGAIALFVYVLIACSQLKMRRQLEREAPEKPEGEDVAVPVPDLLRDRRDGHGDRLDGAGQGRALAAHPELHLAHHRAARVLVQDAAPSAARRPCRRAPRHNPEMEQVALVTGAGSGIGRHVAHGLLEAGYRVVLAGRRREALEETRGGRRAGDGRARRRDPTPRRSRRCSRGSTGSTCSSTTPGRSGRRGRSRTSPLEDWKTVVDTNLTGAFLCAQAAYRVMKAQDPRGGRIINNGSISAHVPRPHAIAYTATKHAITGLTRAISLEGRAHDIACGQIDVGNAATEMAAAMQKGVLQANGTIAAEPVMDVAHTAAAVVYMAGLPLDANVEFMTIMATKMPYIGRG